MASSLFRHPFINRSTDFCASMLLLHWSSGNSDFDGRAPILGLKTANYGRQQFLYFTVYKAFTQVYASRRTKKLIKNTLVGIVPGKTLYMVLLCRQLCRSCPSVLTVNLSNLNRLNHKDFSSLQVDWNIFVWNCFPYILERWSQMFPIQLKLDAVDAFCLSAERNRTNRVDWVQ